jgi:hypothetical protein
VNGERDAGYYTMSWDRKDERGIELSNGIYFYRLVSGDPALSEIEVYAETRKMILLK